MHQETEKAYVVLMAGFFGIAKNLKEAAQNCQKAGARKTERANVRLVIGDDKPVFDGWFISAKAGSEIISIGKGFKLGQLLALEKE